MLTLWYLFLDFLNSSKSTNHSFRIMLTLLIHCVVKGANFFFRDGIWIFRGFWVFATEKRLVGRLCSFVCLHDCSLQPSNWSELILRLVCMTRGPGILILILEYGLPRSYLFIYFCLQMNLCVPETLCGKPWSSIYFLFVIKRPCLFVIRYSEHEAVLASSHRSVKHIYCRFVVVLLQG